MASPHILLCTVGTSLFGNLTPRRQAARRPSRRSPAQPGRGLCRPKTGRPSQLTSPLSASDDRVCGAEINSVASLLDKGYAVPDCGLYFFHSATDDGRNIAAILVAYFRSRGHAPVEAVEVADLQDADPRRFRTHGLRHLARAICRVIRDYSAAACAINATGGYKAQIAIAVLLGQPSLCRSTTSTSDSVKSSPSRLCRWPSTSRCGCGPSGLLFDLGREPRPADDYADDWDERYESLVERVKIDDRDYLELSPTGQIFHETFRYRFRSHRDQVLPPAVLAGQKKPPILKSDEGHMLAHAEEIKRFLNRVTQEVPQVALCVTSYFNPDLPRPSGFRVKGEGIEGIYGGGSWCAKFRVETSAQTAGQRDAVVATLNEWLAGQG